MTDIPTPIYFSRTSAEKDEYCKRAGYYLSVFGERGIVPAVSGWDLVFGNICHAAVEQLATIGSIDYAAVRAKTLAEASKVHNPLPAEAYTALAEGLLRGFALTIWPRLMQEYDVYQTEQDCAWEIEPGVWFLFRQDLVLRNKFSGSLTYYEYKTTSTTSADWIASWNKSIQLHSSMYAIREHLGTQIDYAIVQGLYKGYKDKKTGVMVSPMTKGWVNRQLAMTPEYSYEYQRARGWEGFSTFQEFPDLKSWVNNMPPEKLSEQFPQTAPITPRDDIAKKFFRQQLIREKEVLEVKQRLQQSTDLDEITYLLDKHFKQNFTKCQPAYGGWPCEYREICWQGWVEADPLGSGLFVPRYPHHQAEAKALGLEP